MILSVTASAAFFLLHFGFDGCLLRKSCKKLDVVVLCVLVEFLGYAQSLELAVVALRGKTEQTYQARRRPKVNSKMTLISTGKRVGTY